MDRAAWTLQMQLQAGLRQSPGAWSLTCSQAASWHQAGTQPACKSSLPGHMRASLAAEHLCTSCPGPEGLSRRALSPLGCS